MDLQNTLKEWRMNMNKKEIKQLEKVVADVVGTPVQIIRAEEIVEPTVDMKLLEMENKMNLLRHQQRSIRESRELKKANRLDRIEGMILKAVDVMDNPQRIIKKSKVLHSVLNYFFDLDGEDEEVKYTIEGHYDHQKNDRVEEGKVVYLSKDFKNLK